MDFNTQHLTHLADLAWIWAAQFLPRLGAAVLILGVGFVAARWLSRAVNAALARAPHVDRTLHPILVSWCDMRCWCWWRSSRSGKSASRPPLS